MYVELRNAGRGGLPQWGCFLNANGSHVFCTGLKVELCRVRRQSREQLNIMSLLWFVTYLNLHSLHSCLGVGCSGRGRPLDPSAWISRPNKGLK